jgi:LmbE family N-acetylglucosaminyl deacetylase
MKVLVIAVHPDDETLGCGGTLLKLAANGDEIHWMLVTSMHAPEFTPEQAAGQEARVAAVQRAFPFRSLHWLKLPTLRLDTLPMAGLVAAMRKPIEDLRPDLVIIPNPTDAHSDHRVAAQAALAVLKSFYLPALGVRKVMAMETLSETEAAAPLGAGFRPQVFVDITGSFARKQEILGLYTEELHPDPLPRGPSSVQALARHRGATIGTTYAEAFMLVRERL